MRNLLIALAFLPIAAMADNPYRLDIGAEVHGNNLTVEPTVLGPADKSLRYEMKVRREGEGRSSNSSQSGTVKLDAQGTLLPLALETDLDVQTVALPPFQPYLDQQTR